MLVVSNFLIVGLKLTELEGNLRYLWSLMVGNMVTCVVCLPLGSSLPSFPFLGLCGSAQVELAASGSLSAAGAQR